MVCAMRFLAFFAFFALQVSSFTCGFDIHVHAVDSDMGHMTEHFHGKGEHQADTSKDHGCHLHASHTLDVVDEHQGISISAFTYVLAFIATDSYLKTLSFGIEHPPQT